ncbi:MAG: ribonuclease Z [Deltaproteobacteria bacterium]|nr:ribonuclease Z [Deltaproteobacteria bacterium]
MPYREILRELDGDKLRIEKGAMHVDLIRTSMGLLRVGSMPDISKSMTRFGLREVAVIVPEWTVSQAGDNYTGEEFVLWHAQVYGSPKRNYIGNPENIGIVYRNLDAIFSYYFDKKRIKIIRKDWLNQWIEKIPVEASYELDLLKILFKHGNIMIFDEGREVYNLKELLPSNNADDLVEEVLTKVSRDSVPRDCLEITTVGSGNGFFKTASSFLVRFGSRVLWVDPCPQPAHSLAKVGVHWDDVTEIFITHNHEDHILGFTACLKRKIDRKERLKLITVKGIYQALKKQFSPLFPEMDNWIDLMEIAPGRVFDLDGMKISSRWNHHFLPYGTLGIKINAGDRTWGLSGDTKFDTSINRILKRADLTESWFRDCDLVFHEVDFDNSEGVHTYWKEVDKIRRAIPGELFVYHTCNKDSPPILIAQEGKTY